MGRIDFEDMLTLAVRLLEEHRDAAATFRDRFHAFTVDEFQDVNPLQAALLDAWLGDRDEVCVVGDDYQTIYSFTGASPTYLTGFAARHPGAQVVTLTENYRSSPQVLGLANGLARHFGGEPRALVATRDDGPPPGAQQLSRSRPRPPRWWTPSGGCARTLACRSRRSRCCTGSTRGRSRSRRRSRRRGSRTR